MESAEEKLERFLEILSKVVKISEQIEYYEKMWNDLECEEIQWFCVESLKGQSKLYFSVNGKEYKIIINKDLGDFSIGKTWEVTFLPKVEKKIKEKVRDLLIEYVSSMVDTLHCLLKENYKLMEIEE